MSDSQSERVEPDTPPQSPATTTSNSVIEELLEELAYAYDEIRDLSADLDDLRWATDSEPDVEPAWAARMRAVHATLAEDPAGAGGRQIDDAIAAAVPDQGFEDATAVAAVAPPPDLTVGPDTGPVL